MSRIKLVMLMKTGFFHVFGSSVINKIIAFMSSIVLVRILTKQEYGVFTYSWNIYSIVLLLNGMGIDSGVLQLSSEKSGDTIFADRTSNYGTRFGLRFNIILMILLLGIGLFAPLKIKGAGRLLCFLCLMPAAQLLYQMTTVYLRSQKQNQEFARITVLNTVLIFISSAIMALILREIGLIIGYYIAYLTSYAIGIIGYHVNILNHTEQLGKKDRYDLLKISFISMLNTGLSQAMYLLDIFIIGVVNPKETILASYKVSTMIPSALTFIPIALVTYLYPYFAEHRKDGSWCLQAYKKVLLGLSGTNFIIAIVLFLEAPLIIQLFFGAQYLDAVPVFRILSLNYFISGTFRIISGNLLVTQRKLTFNLFVAVVSSIANVIADYLFIRWWGSLGAAMATVLVVVISSILSTGYLVHIFYRNRKVK